jgi:hypothetical protein
MNRREWAAARHSYKFVNKYFSFGESLPIPSNVPEFISSKLKLSCSVCQDFMAISYGSAECSVCPLADFVARLNRLDPTRPYRRLKSKM